MMTPRQTAVRKRAQRKDANVTHNASMPHNEVGCFHAREDEEDKSLIVSRQPHAINR